MKVLLDTHAFLWFIAGDSQLGAQARSIIEDPSNDVKLSIVSVWEIAIKNALRKLTLASPFRDVFPALITSNNFGLLPIEIAHAICVNGLPLHHRDPFDRLLIAQAIVEEVPILTKDGNFGLYDVTKIW
jgi:PIN domain nuclease of toxin-antitoxin system